MPGAHAVLSADGAGWHQRGKHLCVPENLTLLDLPPYAPELNPMENVWDFLRANKLCAWSGTTTTPSSTPAQGWDFLIGDPERIRSIGTREWTCSQCLADWYYTLSASGSSSAQR